MEKKTPQKRDFTHRTKSVPSNPHPPTRPSPSGVQTQGRTERMTVKQLGRQLAADVAKQAAQQPVPKSGIIARYRFYSQNDDGKGFASRKQFRAAKKAFAGKKPLRFMETTVKAQLRRCLMSKEQKKQRRMLLRRQTGCYRHQEDKHGVA